MSDGDRQAFARAMFHSLPGALVAWRGHEQMAHDIEARLKIELDRCGNRAFGEQFSQAWPVAGCEPRDYQQRIINAGNGQRLLAGIRFHGCRGFPFVELLAATQPLDHATVLEQAIGILYRSFHKFDPHAIRMAYPSANQLCMPAGVEARVDYHFVAGRVDLLAAADGKPTSQSVELQHTDDAKAAAQFVARAYEGLFDEHPSLREVLDPAGEEELAACADSGVLAYAVINGTQAGVLASQEELGPVVKGQCIVEQVLCKAFRKQGYGSVSQRRLIEWLASKNGKTILWGTIDHHNDASRATARSNGRRELLTWYWLKDSQSGIGSR